MVLGLIPVSEIEASQVPQQGGAITVDEFTEREKNEAIGDLGFDTQLETFDQEDDSNPYTKNKDTETSLFSTDELMITSGQNAAQIHDLASGENSQFVGATSTTTTNLNSTTKRLQDLGKHDFMRTLAFDPFGHGQKDFIICQYADLITWTNEDTGNKVNCVAANHAIIDARTGQYYYSGSYQDYFVTNYYEIESFQIGSLLPLAVGDYDGDGCDEVAIYEPIVSDYHPGDRYANQGAGFIAIKHLTLLTSTNTYHLETCDSIYLEDVLGTDPKVNNCHADTTLTVDFATVNQKKRDVDDLVITTSYGRHTSIATAKNAYTKVYVWEHPLVNEKYNEYSITEFNMQWDHHLYDTSQKAGELYETMMFGGAAAGDIDNDGDQEIVIAGYRLDDPEMDCWDLDDEKFLIYYIELNDQNKYVNGSKGGVAQWVTMDDDSNYYSGEDLLISGGFYTGNNPTESYKKFMEPMAVECFAEKGAGYSESIFVEGYILELKDAPGYYEGPTTSGNDQAKNEGFDLRYTMISYEMITKGASDSTLKEANNVYITDVAVGNFDGNTFGMEQLACAFNYQKAKSDNCDYYADLLMVGQTSPGEVSCDYVETKSPSSGQCLGKISNHVMITKQFYTKQENCIFALCAIDCDDDGVRAKFKNKYSYFANPNVAAILQAAPFYKDLESSDYPSNQGTSLTKTKGSAQGQEHTVDISAGFVAGFEQDVSILGLFDVFGVDFEQTFSASVGYAYESELESSSSVSYTNQGTTDLVVAAVTPYTRYVYDIYVPVTKMPTESEYTQMKTNLSTLNTWLSNNSSASNTEEYLTKQMKATQLTAKIADIKADIDDGKKYGRLIYKENINK